MEELEMIYCHTPEAGVNNKGWYYYHSYYFGDSKFYDVKESNNRFSKTLLCVGESHFDNYFYTKDQLRDLKINEILKINE